MCIFIYNLTYDIEYNSIAIDNISIKFKNVTKIKNYNTYININKMQVNETSVSNNID